tara:strand:- start:70 stop:1266 length:1197 start_codon:yes stop_codon:yes gene_type:complete
MTELAQVDGVSKSRYGQRRCAAPPGVSEAEALLTDLINRTCSVSPVQPSAPITLYGGGDMGRMARRYFEALGHEVAYVIDRDAEALRIDPFWSGVKVFHPDAVPARVKREVQLLLCVATSPLKPLETALRAEGWTDIVPFYDVAESQRERHPLSNGWFAPPLDAYDSARTSAVLARWDDDLSRAHHLQFLAWRLLREEWVFDGMRITDEDRFLIPEILARAGAMELIVDAGAHHGVVTRKLVALNGISRIVAIEPDAENRVILERSLADITHRITVYPFALGDAPGEHVFHAGLGYASQLSATGQGTTRVVTLDNLALAPDFMKLHLEGAELATLKGARETLRRHRPILAITTYHNADGIWRTPAWLMEHLPRYRFLFRTHSWCGTGAVVYALPEESE